MKKTMVILLMSVLAMTFVTELGAEAWSASLIRPEPVREAAGIVSETLTESEEPDGEPDAPADLPWREPDPEADTEVYALFGVDAEEGEAGRSDCILLLSLDGDVLRMCSLARDTLVTIPGTGEETKLGHAYAYGGPELAMETIRENFGVQVTRFASVNFTQMPRLVELLGGVEVPLTEEEWDCLGLDWPYLGQRRLSGQEALRYCRIRSIDSDDQRTARQRTVVAALVSALETVPRAKLPELALTGMELTTTNLKLGDVLHLGKQVLAHRDGLRVESLAIPGDAVSAWGGIRSDGIWYYVYDLDQARDVLRDYFGGGQVQTVQGVR